MSLLDTFDVLFFVSIDVIISIMLIDQINALISYKPILSILNAYLLERQVICTVATNTNNLIPLGAPEYKNQELHQLRKLQKQGSMP